MSDVPTISLPVAVVDSDQSIRNRLAMQLGEQAVAFDSIAELESRLPSSPVIVVFGPSCADARNLASLETLLRSRPDVGAILVAEELTTDLFQRAMRIGVRDVLSAPVETAQLTEGVRRVAAGISQSMSVRGALVEDPSLQSSGETGQVITVFSTKGGAGKSVVACNLGVALARKSDRPVVLIDADLQFGDCAVMLKLAPQRTVVDAVNAIDQLDASMLAGMLIKHEPSGLLVLPAPLEPAFADQITAEYMTTIVDLLRSIAAYVVIDTPAYFNDIVLTLIEMSDDVLLVAGMDVPNIKNVKIGLQTLRMLNTPMSKLHLVLNRANAKVKLDVNEVERTLQVRAESQIPSDVAVPQSVNKGVPVVLDAPKSGVARSLEALAEMFLSEDAAAEAR
ncbi:MAG TPA: P-loop NTPase [Acidimicrobiales bacterium]|nr:P-loop NTPase [Acidimicrobiales bacterium]